MYHIKLLNKISKAGLSRLTTDLYTCGDSAENPEGILVRSADMHEYAMPESLLCIARSGAGVNNIPVDKCSEAGIIVFNTPGANANAVKELAICSLLLASRKIVNGIEWAKTLQGKSDEVPELIEKGKSAFVGPEIAGKKLGIIGLGAIGAIFANAATDLGMEVYGYDPYMTVDAAWLLYRDVKRAKSENYIYENCDYISIHVPYNAETKNKICKATLNKMKNGVRILNLARGALVNDTDMGEALESGKVACYVSDFPNDTTLGFKNAICIPHLGASTPESEENCAEMASAQLADFLENGNIKNSVNFPNVEMPRTAQTRLCVIHKNIPNMLSSISSAFAAEGINIENMINKSKGDYAYTIVDTNSDINKDIVSHIRSVNGIVRIRIIR